MASIQALSTNTVTKNLVLKLIRKTTVNNPKSKSPIHKHLFTDGLHYLQLTQFNRSAFQNYKEQDIVSLNGFLISGEPTESAYWFKTNLNDIQLVPNSGISVAEVLDVDIPVNYTTLSELASLDSRGKQLFSIKCIIKSFERANFQSGTKLSFVLLDLEENITLDMTLWNTEMNFDVGFEYHLNHVLLDTIRGYSIGKTWATTFEKLAENKRVHYAHASCNNLSSTKLQAPQFNNWGAVISSTSLIVSLKVHLVDCFEKNGVTFRFKDSNENIRYVAAWNLSVLAPTIKQPLDLETAIKHFQKMIGERFEIKCSVTRKRQGDQADKKNLNDSSSEKENIFFSLLKIDKV